MATLGTFAAGQVLTAAELNAIATWTAFTPTWTFGGTAPTMATNVGQYTVINELVVVQAHMKYTSGGSAGNLELTLPAAASIDPVAAYVKTGYGTLYDSNTTTLYHVSAGPNASSTTVWEFWSHGQTGVVTLGANPFAWAANDEIAITIIGKKA